MEWQDILADITDRSPPSDDPRCFSFFLAHLVHVYDEFRVLFDRALSQSYRKAFEEYLKIRFPGGLALLGRGLHDIVLSKDILQRIELGDRLACGESVAELSSLPAGLSGFPSNGKCRTSWSENVIHAVTQFALMPTGTSFFHKRLPKGWRKIPLGAVCLIGEIPLSRVASFGVSSETGPFEEAEVHVEAPTTDYVQAVFGVTDLPGKSVGRKVSPAEQRYYGLSGQIAAWVTLREKKRGWIRGLVYLHPDTDMSLFGDKLIRMKRLEPRVDWRRLV